MFTLKILPVLALIKLLSQSAIVRYKWSRLHKIFRVLLPNTLQENMPLNIIDLSLIRRVDSVGFELVRDEVLFHFVGGPVAEEIRFTEEFTFGELGDLH